jgi:hypothetical protein
MSVLQGEMEYQLARIEVLENQIAVLLKSTQQDERRIVELAAQLVRMETSLAELWAALRR